MTYYKLRSEYSHSAAGNPKTPEYDGGWAVLDLA